MNAISATESSRFHPIWLWFADAFASRMRYPISNLSIVWKSSYLSFGAAVVCHLDTLYSSVAIPKSLGDKSFDFWRATVFCLKHRFSLQKNDKICKKFGGMPPNRLRLWLCDTSARVWVSSSAVKCKPCVMSPLKVFQGKHTNDRSAAKCLLASQSDFCMKSLLDEENCARDCASYTFCSFGRRLIATNTWEDGGELSHERRNRTNFLGVLRVVLNWVYWVWCAAFVATSTWCVL